jgi:hypothetical protein
MEILNGISVRNGGADDNRIRKVSTVQQDYEGQLAALTAAGAEKVYAEKISGTVTDRKELSQAINALTAVMCC